VIGYPSFITVGPRRLQVYLYGKYKTEEEVLSQRRMMKRMGFRTVISKHNCNPVGVPEKYGIYYVKGRE
jgi:hypothetical protein